MQCAKTLRPPSISNRAIADRNGKVTITTKELDEVMSSLGRRPTPAELVDLIKEVDPDGNGTIGLQEFLAMMTRDMGIGDIESDEEDSDDLVNFGGPDADKGGYIKADDLRHVLKDLGRHSLWLSAGPYSQESHNQ